MPSYSTPIAEAVVTQLTGLTPSGCPIEFRKTASLVSRESVPRVIVTSAKEMQSNRGTFGGLQAGKYGTVEKAYTVQITVYQSNQAELEGDDVNPSFILAAKQKLNTWDLPGVDVVYDSDLVENLEWENQPFGAGVQQSYFAMVFYTAEPRNG